MNNETKQIPTYLTVRQVAAYLIVSERTIYSWVSAKRIPFERKGGLLRFRLDQVTDWNERHR